MPSKERTKIESPISGMDLAYAISEGNPGALYAVGEILSLGDVGIQVLSYLGDMNIRGSQLAYAFNEICGRNLNVLIQRVAARDPAMVDAVNAFFRSGYKAVTEGALTAKEIPTFEKT